MLEFCYIMTEAWDVSGAWGLRFCGCIGHFCLSGSLTERGCIIHTRELLPRSFPDTLEQGISTLTGK